jgi:Domain of unknown function (DUF4129)
MSTSAGRRAAAVGAGVAVLVFLVALGSNRTSRGGIGQPLEVHVSSRIIVAVLTLLGFAALAAVVYAFWGDRAAPQEDEPLEPGDDPEREWWEEPLLVGLGFVAVAALVVVVRLLVGGTPKETRPAPRPGGVAATTPSPGHAAHDTLAVHWWTLLVLVAVCGGIAAVAWWRRRGTSQRRERAANARLRAALDVSIRELEGEPDPRRAVIRAYVAMERALAGHGAGRKASEAPVEYLHRSLAAVRGGRRARELLTSLYAHARFSPLDVDARMKDDAVGALNATRDALDANE